MNQAARVPYTIHRPEMIEKVEGMKKEEIVTLLMRIGKFNPMGEKEGHIYTLASIVDYINSQLNVPVELNKDRIRRLEKYALRKLMANGNPAGVEIKGE